VADVPADETSGNGASSPDSRAPDVRLPAVSLPKSGGAIRGLGEKFSVNAANGSATATVPLPLSTGRSGFTPKLNLTYDSGAGNGIFGFGWALDTPVISRKTDRGLPRYLDSEESDVFILSGAEDLVPVLNDKGTRQHLSRTAFGTHYDVWLYRPRIEGLYARIERWVSVETGITHWRSISRENVTTLYGYDDTSRVCDPSDPLRIFSWHISRSWDCKGNVAVYFYMREDSAGIASGSAHEANRTPSGRAAQIYLKSIAYAGATPYLPDWTAPAETPLPQQWHIKVALDYGDHTATPPTPQPDQPWPLRPDPFSTYRPAFELRTYRRVQRLLIFHDFANEPTAGADVLVRSVDLRYSDQDAPTDARNPVYTFLASLTRSGYRRVDAAVVSRCFPSLEFDYATPVIGADVLALERDSVNDLPEGIDGARYRFLDLDGEGLPGILASTERAWWYKRNLGAGNLVAQADGTLVARARFGALEPVQHIPSRDGLSGQQFLDLAGEGRQDLVALAEPDAGFYRRSEDYDFDPFKRFALLPDVDWTDPNLRFVDLTGDGLADVLLTEDGLFTVYASLGEVGFGRGPQVPVPWDEERGPRLVISDGTGTIFIADMTGDGLNDLVRVRNGEACYWPNIGYGRFGAKVSMDRAPRFEAQESFDPARIRLADVDGTGAADIVYVGGKGVRVWFNQSGNSWSDANLVGIFPSTDQLGSVQVMDLLGTGTACLVWSSPLPGERTPLLYVDLMSGRKPYLMTALRNNLGAETRVTYAPSTRFYVADAAAGRPWVTRLAFPVQVVTRCETIDWIGRNRQVARYAYHHGYFDGFEREFRGFGMVEQWDTDEFRTDTDFADSDSVDFDQQSFSAPMLTRSWFHTGAFRQAIPLNRQYAGEYWVEPALRDVSRGADAAAMSLPDTVLPAGLDAFEIQEAYRALKGHPLRVEVYAQDGANAASNNPYSVAETNFTLTCLQRRGINRHAVFAVAPRESLTFCYERASDDPRVSHALTLESDAYGNPLRALTIGYPRRAGYAAPEPTLSTATQAMLAYDQTRLHVRGDAHIYTHAIDDLAQWPDAYRTPMQAGADTAEITGAAPTPKGSGITHLFTFDEADALWQTVWRGTKDIPYEQVPASDVDGQGAPATVATRRLTGQSRILYRSDDLTALLPSGQLEPLAIIGETYRAVTTPGQIASLFGALVTPAMLTGAGYVQLTGEAPGWWSPSGRMYLSPGDADTPSQELVEARLHFFLPRRMVDPFGGVNRVTHDAYDLLGVSATDPVNNLTSVDNDYRVLAAAMLNDPNGNGSAVAFDALGQVIATAVTGPKNGTLGDRLTGFEADPDAVALATFFANPLSQANALIGHATTRLVYDLDAFTRTAGSAQPMPAVVATLARETRVSDLSGQQSSPLQYGLAYSDGFGREVQRKTRVADGPLIRGGAVAAPRWLGSGWTVFDNKGRPVRQYEPFFSVTSAFEFAAQTGVASTLFYDPPGRGIAVLHPDQSWIKTVITAWARQTWDANDTIRIDDPRTDANIGETLSRALGGGVFTSWYQARIDDTFGATAEDHDAQQDAAAKASVHAATPAITHFDALGRSCLTVADCGAAGRFPSRMALDTEGRPLALYDALGRRTQQNVFSTGAMNGAQYIAGSDMLGRQLYHVNADAGAHRALSNSTGQPVCSWDARGQAFRIIYDAARRTVQRFVSTQGAAEILIDLTVWGEGQAAAANLAGRVFRHYDAAGFTENTAYDYAGNLSANRRQLGSAYRTTPDWSALATLTQAADLDAAAQMAGLVPTGDAGRDSFVASVLYDALNRPIQSVTPHSTTMRPNVLRRSYDAGGMLFAVDLWLQQENAPVTLLDPASADRHAVTSITYNPRGQRESIACGNGVSSAYEYDSETFRLIRMTTTRPASIAADQRTVQDLRYYYDPVGNITRLRDDADTQNVIYFSNQRVEPSADYTYDPLYRLTVALGREHLGQTSGTLSAPQQVTNDDAFRMRLPQPGDGRAMGNYTERYSYDAVGNLLAMEHKVASNGWTRRYAYAEASRVRAGETGNRLSSTSLAGDPDNGSSGPYGAAYRYNEHGSMIAMPHLPSMSWDQDERLRLSARQIVNAGTPATTWYVYGQDGGRVRKVSDAMAAEGQTPVRTAERIDLGGVEVYREYGVDGVSVSLSRETLHINAGDFTVAYVETRTAGEDAAPPQQMRYQHANHLGSALLELADDAGILTYEEYFPFGATSYQAVALQTDAPKRYRYTGRERDEENDLGYHGARYYAPWLGRWTACDPAGLADHPNLFVYARNNPVCLLDPQGTQSADSQAQPSSATERKLTDELKSATAKAPTAAGILREHRPRQFTLRADPSAAAQASGSTGSLGPPPDPRAEKRNLDTPATKEESKDKRKDEDPPKPVDAANAITATWTNPSQTFELGSYGWEYGQQFSLGTAGPGVLSQGTFRAGLGKGFEVGAVGNVSLANPVTGAGGFVLRAGPSELDASKFKPGGILQATLGSAQAPSGDNKPVVAVSGSFIESRGGDKAMLETDVNVGGAYTNFGTFGPGTSSVPHLLSLPVVTAGLTRALDPLHVNSLGGEVQAAPTLSLGNAHVWGGARVGAGVNFSTASTNSLLTFSANGFADLTSRGVGASGLFTITFAGKGSW
jgi:RHS repeat-associated protein